MKRLISFLLGKEGDHAAIVWIAIIALAVWSAIGHKPTLEDWVQWKDVHRTQYTVEYLKNYGYSTSMEYHGDWEKAVPMIVETTSNIINTNVENWSQEKGTSVKYVILNAYTLVGSRLGSNF